MDCTIGKFTTISQIVEPFGQAVYPFRCKAISQQEQFSTARKNPHLESAQSKKDKRWDIHCFLSGF